MRTEYSNLTLVAKYKSERPCAKGVAVPPKLAWEEEEEGELFES